MVCGTFRCPYVQTAKGQSRLEAGCGPDLGLPALDKQPEKAIRSPSSGAELGEERGQGRRGVGREIEVGGGKKGEKKWVGNGKRSGREKRIGKESEWEGKGERVDSRREKKRNKKEKISANEKTRGSGLATF